MLPVTRHFNYRELFWLSPAVSLASLSVSQGNLFGASLHSAIDYVAGYCEGRSL